MRHKIWVWYKTAFEACFLATAIFKQRLDCFSKVIILDQAQINLGEPYSL